jgi:hypothetical protein
MLFENSLEQLSLSLLVEILPKFCFCGATFGRLTFGARSQLNRMKKLCFNGCCLRSLCIPRSVEILDQKRFSQESGGETQIGALLFECNSRLQRIEKGGFSQCIFRESYIPSVVKIIHEKCFAGPLQARSD